jgi:hypothetical protein
MTQHELDINKEFNERVLTRKVLIEKCPYIAIAINSFKGIFTVMNINSYDEFNQITYKGKFYRNKRKFKAMSIVYEDGIVCLDDSKMWKYDYSNFDFTGYYLILSSSMTNRFSMIGQLVSKDDCEVLGTIWN